jgi:hypothetical protein
MASLLRGHSQLSSCRLSPWLLTIAVARFSCHSALPADFFWPMSPMVSFFSLAWPLMFLRDVARSGIASRTCCCCDAFDLVPLTGLVARFFATIWLALAKPLEGFCGDVAVLGVQAAEAWSSSHEDA